MATRQDPVHVGMRRGQSLLRTLADDYHEARIGAGLSQEQLADAVGLSQPRISRIERGLQANLSVLDAAQIAAALGMELSVRVFPAGPPLRDAAHLALLERFRSRMSPTLGWHLEVPLPEPGDQRAIDGVIRKGSERVGIEAEVRLRDVQAVIRKAELKQRDGRLDRMVLLVAATKTNRSAVRSANAVLRHAFPLDTRQVLSALAAGDIPRANGVVLL